MFVEHRPPKADDAAKHPRDTIFACKALSPRNAQLQRFMCTRHALHRGHHLASIGAEGELCEVVAEWDDDRATDGQT